MKPIIYNLATLFGLLGSAAPGLAQYLPNLQPPFNPNPGTPPTVSPYINLSRGLNPAAGSPGIAYYGLVRPQVDFRSSIGQLQNYQEAQRVGAEEAAITGPVITGNAASFQTHTRFFQTRGAGVGAGGGGAAGGVGAALPRPQLGAPGQGTTIPLATRGGVPLPGH
jgi:hypothetical protein